MSNAKLFKLMALSATLLSLSACGDSVVRNLLPGENWNLKKVSDTASGLALEEIKSDVLKFEVDRTNGVTTFKFLSTAARPEDGTETKADAPAATVQPAPTKHCKIVGETTLPTAQCAQGYEKCGTISAKCPPNEEKAQVAIYKYHYGSASAAQLRTESLRLVHPEEAKGSEVYAEYTRESKIEQPEQKGSTTEGKRQEVPASSGTGDPRPATGSQQQEQPPALTTDEHNES